MTKVTEIQAVAPFGIRVRFSDGRAGAHDCTADIAGEGPMVKPLQDPVYFALVHLEGGAPTWPNGFDMCPEWLRTEMEKAGELSASAAAE